MEAPNAIRTNEEVVERWERQKSEEGFSFGFVWFVLILIWGGGCCKVKYQIWGK